MSVPMEGCGEAASTDTSDADKAARCPFRNPVRCEEDYPDLCTATRRIFLDVENECYSTSVPLGCADKVGCIEGEWFASDDRSGWISLHRGCVNEPLPGTNVVDEPSQDVVAASAVSCDEALAGMGDAACMEFSPQECPVEDGCLVRLEQRFDPERGCADEELVEVCRGTQLSLPLVWETCE